MQFRSRTIRDPDGNLHHNPAYVRRTSVNLKREHAPLLFVVAGLLALAAAVLVFRQFSFELHALKAEGAVIRNERVVSSKTSKNGRHSETVSFRPVIAFTDSRGQHREITSLMTYNPPLAIGQKQTLLYDPANPDSASIDSFGNRFGLAIICAALGAAIGAMALYAQIVNPGTYSSVNINGKVWRTEGPGPPPPISTTTISFGRKD